MLHQLVWSPCLIAVRDMAVYGNIYSGHYIPYPVLLHYGKLKSMIQILKSVKSNRDDPWGLA